MGELTRREILKAFLGMAALQTISCDRKATLPEGKLVDLTLLEQGHRIRDGLQIEPTKRQPVSVVIVGCGVAGLVAGWTLRQAGFEDFLLLELDSTVGGTARSGRNSFISYPWGAHYVPVPRKENADLIEFLQQIGVVEGKDETGEPIVAEQYLCRDPEERVFYKGHWYEGLYLSVAASQEDLAEWNRFHQEIDYWVEWRDARGRRAFDIPLENSSDDPEVTKLDRISMREYLAHKGFKSARLLWYIEYGCRDDYGLKLDTTSAWAGLFYFASRMKRAGEDAQQLMAWPAGNGYLVDRLYSKVSDKVWLNSAAVTIIPTEAYVDIDVLRDGREAIGLRAQRAIFAAPQFLRKYVLRTPVEQRFLEAFEYGSWMVANLTLRDRPYSLGFPLAWDNVLYESPSLGYVVATHQALMDYGPTVFTYYYPVIEDNPRQARQKMLSIGWQEWVEIVLADLKRAHRNIAQLTERIDVMRWGHAMILPRPGFIWSKERQLAKQPIGRVHFAASDLSGVALFEEAFYQGRRAAREVLVALGIV